MLSMRRDPSRTGLLVRKFWKEMDKRFRWLMKEVDKLLVEEDSFGLKKAPHVVMHAVGQFAFATNPQKVEAFQKWLKEQVDSGVLEVSGGKAVAGKPWTYDYVQSAYKKGRTRAYIDSKKADLATSPEWYQGSKEQFLSTAFMQPETISKLELLGTRAFEQLKGLTATMSQQINTTLMTGLANGWGPLKIASEMRKQVGSLSVRRARTIARTEVMYAHAEGQLDSFEDLHVERLGVIAELSTAGDDRVCEHCAGLEGHTYTVDEARGIIPVHPNCRCVWIPSALKIPTEVPVIPKPETNRIDILGVAPDAAIKGGKSYTVIDEHIGGSTGAQLVKVGEKKYVMKRYLQVDDPSAHAQNEYLANRLIAAMKLENGGRVPKSFLGKVEGKWAVFNEYQQNVQLVGADDALVALAQSKAKQDFVTHAWLGNWDVAGLNLDNVAVKGKQLYYLDNGGALIYRARGALKGKAWGDTVGELTTMLNPSTNPSSAKLFKGMTDDKLIKAIDAFKGRFEKNVGWARLQREIANSGLPIKSQEGLFSTLFDRYQSVVKKRDDLWALAVRDTGKAAKMTAVDRVYSSVTEMENDVLFKLEEKMTGLLSRERGVIRTFTSSKYARINGNVLKGKITEEVKLLDKTLEKFPKFKGLSYRGVRNYDTSLSWEQWSTGRWAKVEWKAYSSSSVKPTAAFGSQDGLLFIIKNKGRQGRYIGKCSKIKHEMELLMERGSQFRVVGYCENPIKLGLNVHKRTLIIEEVAGKIPESQVAPKKWVGKELTEWIKKEEELAFAD